MWKAVCSCYFTEESSRVYEKYWDDEKQECICPRCGRALDIEKWGCD